MCQMAPLGKLAWAPDEIEFNLVFFGYHKQRNSVVNLKRVSAQPGYFGRSLGRRFNFVLGALIPYLKELGSDF